MEELLTLKELLHQGKISEALLVVEQLEEISKSAHGVTSASKLLLDKGLSIVQDGEKLRGFVRIIIILLWGVVQRS